MTLTDLQNKIDNSGKNKSVHTEYPHLAKFLQLIYFQNPDFKKFITLLLNFDKEIISAKEILSKLIIEYPNLFINFFVKPKEKSTVMNIFLKGEKESLIKDFNTTIEAYGHYNFFFAFKRHLVHLGILSSENSTFYGKKEDYNIHQDIWYLGKDILI